METAIIKQFVIGINVCIAATLTGIILFTVIMGFSIINDGQDVFIEQYSKAGLSMIIDASNSENVDAVNLYKIMDSNRNIIVTYEILNTDKSLVKDIITLLDRPTDRFSIVIEGNSSIGFQVSAQQIKGVFDK